MDKVHVPLNDLGRQYQALKPVVDEAVARVLRSGWYILGPEVEKFEHEFARYCQAAYCVGVANGTDALEIGLRALGIAAGDQVITVANAGMYSTTAIRAIGAVPVFAEIDPYTLTMDPAALEAAITPRTRAVVVTHLYGRAADIEQLAACARRHGLALVEDCAQAHGAAVAGRRVGSWGDVGCFSFYPTKNLGALGDGGAVLTNDAQVAERARQLRQYGWVRKYDSRVAGGRNSRLDEIQAAILRAKLPYLDGWNQARRQLAAQYKAGLDQQPLQLPAAALPEAMIFHLYVVRTAERDRLRRALVEQGIGCDVHYAIPDHLQESCADLGYGKGALPQTELAAEQVLSLPCFAELTAAEVEQVVVAVRRGLATPAS
ncbi:MAG: DegT/DnrJ/EryC1/StrS family aminotransferase [Anaerolineae bacterium]